MNACNHVTMNVKGDAIASCDADGVVKLWDVRMVSEIGTLSAASPQHPLNRVSFDRSSTVIAAASDDGTIKTFSTETMQLSSELRGHEDAVQCVMFDPADKFMVSTSSDCTFRIWS
jgi:WD40 repeat protein